MSDYSYGDILRMQDEAKQRVIEMQRRSRFAVQNFNSGRSEMPKEKTEEKAHEEPLPRKAKAISYPADLASAVQPRRKAVHNTGGFDLKNALGAVFGNLSADDYERMFILALCLLLSEEKSDESLIIALMYLAA